MGNNNPHFGATFAERKALRLGVPRDAQDAEQKTVSAEEEAVEDKAVKRRRSSTKRA